MGAELIGTLIVLGAIVGLAVLIHGVIAIVYGED